MRDARRNPAQRRYRRAQSGQQMTCRSIRPPGDRPRTALIMPDGRTEVNGTTGLIRIGPSCCRGPMRYLGTTPTVRPPRLRMTEERTDTPTVTPPRPRPVPRLPSRPSAQPPRLRPLTLLLMTAVRPTTTTSACAGTAHSGRQFDHHGLGLCRYCPWRPSMQTPRLRAEPRLPATALSVQPPRLRPVRRLPTAAVCPTTTASASTADAHPGRPSNHRDFGLCCHCSERPSVWPPRVRVAGKRPGTDRHANHPTTTTSACTVTGDHGRLQNAATSACDVAGDHSRPCNHHGFGLCSGR